MRSKLADLFYKNAAEMPQKQAIWCDGKTATYKEMADLVSRYSNFLVSKGVEYGDHVAIPMNNSIESVALFFTAADLGVCLVPLNPTLPLESIKTAMKSGDMKHLIARKSFLSECEKKGGVDVQGITVCLDGDFEGAYSFSEVATMPTTRPACEHIKGDESLILTMTSGSTGTPKPIDISQQNKVDRSLAHIRVYGLTKEDRILAATPLYHSLAERLVILPLILGATSILLPRFTPAIWLKCAEEQKPTFTIAVSAQLAQILELIKQTDAQGIDSFRSIVSSSALLEEKVKLELIDKLQCEFHEMYGTSETSTATDICFQAAHNKQKSVGLPFDEAEVKILRDDEDTECAVREVGEIAVKSKLTCKGYYKLKNMMDLATTDGFFRTGDLGYVDEDGYLYYAGRKKELIITGAINVYPNDVDAVVSQLTAVEECAAFSYPDERLGEVVALAIVVKEDCELNERTVKVFCARNLADFQQPHKIFFVDMLPKNAMGKLQRNRILEHIKAVGLDK
jgi:acyl-CoA synthetase (AMP-forming)/AMP-acid ligase II